MSRSWLTLPAISALLIGTLALPARSQATPVTRPSVGCMGVEGLPLPVVRPGCFDALSTPGPAIETIRSPRRVTALPTATCAAIQGVNDICPASTRTEDLFPGLSEGAEYTALSPSGDHLFVTGTRCNTDGTNCDTFTASYDAATLTRLWIATYDGAKHLQDTPFAIATSPNGRIVFVGGVTDADRDDWMNTSDTLTLAYDAATGALLWQAGFDGGAGDFALGLAVGGGRVFMTGWTLTGTTNPRVDTDYLTIAYDATDGHQAWISTFRGDSHGVGDEDRALAVAATPDGSRVFVTGESAENTGTDAVTVAYVGRDPQHPEREGSRLWLARYDYNGNAQSFEAGVALVVAPDGSRVYVTGQSTGGATSNSAGDESFLTLGYDAATGRQAWMARFGGFHDAGTSYAYLVGVSPQGDRVFVAGMSAVSFPVYRLATLAYDAASGRQLWAMEGQSGEPIEFADALTVSPDGSSVQVAGTVGVPGVSLVNTGGTIPVIGTSHAETHVVQYRASDGSDTLVARYPFPSIDLAVADAAAISPDGRSLFVTGAYLPEGTQQGDSSVLLLRYGLPA